MCIYNYTLLFFLFLPPLFLLACTSQESEERGGRGGKATNSKLIFFLDIDFGKSEDGTADFDFS
jgi:hypothetical protein